MNETIIAVSHILEAIVWPVVAVAAGVYFRQEIRDLAKRLRKGGGAEFDPIPQSTAIPDNPLLTAPSTQSTISKVTSETLDGIPLTPATALWEKWLQESSALKSIETTHEREKVLLRMLARALLVNVFEQAEASIWASQLDLLTYLNSKRQGEKLAQIKTVFYDKAAAQYPTWYQNYSFDAWLAFLQRNRLLAINGDIAMITNEGIDFLGWRIQQARAPKLNG